MFEEESNILSVTCWACSFACMNFCLRVGEFQSLFLQSGIEIEPRVKSIIQYVRPPIQTFIMLYTKKAFELRLNSNHSLTEVYNTGPDNFATWTCKFFEK